MSIDHDNTTKRYDDLIYDVGLLKGEDTAFYLEKGFRVVAFEADPDLVKFNQEMFSTQIANKQLTIVQGAIVQDASLGKVTLYKNKDIRVWGTVNESWARRNEDLGTSNELIEVDTVNFADCNKQYGMPYFMKIDIEGADTVCINTLYDFESGPAYISLESDKVSFDALIGEINTFKELGYNKFIALQQEDVVKQAQPNPAREGNTIDYSFKQGSSVLLGKDLPFAWKTDKEIIRQYRFIFILYKLFSDYALLTRFRVGRKVIYLLNSAFNRVIPGWYDTHAKHSSIK